MVKEMETVEMPAGLLASLKSFILTLPAAAFGNAPLSALVDLSQKLGECRVVEAADADKAA